MDISLFSNCKIYILYIRNICSTIVEYIFIACRIYYLLANIHLTNLNYNLINTSQYGSTI